MIYCFSGTGNTRAVATRLAQFTGDEVRGFTPQELHSPSDALLTTAGDRDKRIIWAFPTYSWGIPPEEMPIHRLGSLGNTHNAHYMRRRHGIHRPSVATNHAFAPTRHSRSLCRDDAEHICAHERLQYRHTRSGPAQTVCHARCRRSDCRLHTDRRTRHTCPPRLVVAQITHHISVVLPLCHVAPSVPRQRRMHRLRHMRTQLSHVEHHHDSRQRKPAPMGRRLRHVSAMLPYMSPPCRGIRKDLLRQRPVAGRTPAALTLRQHGA